MILKGDILWIVTKVFIFILVYFMHSPVSSNYHSQLKIWCMITFYTIIVMPHDIQNPKKYK